MVLPKLRHGEQQGAAEATEALARSHQSRRSRASLEHRAGAAARRGARGRGAAGRRPWPRSMDEGKATQRRRGMAPAELLAGGGRRQRRGGGGDPAMWGRKGRREEGGACMGARIGRRPAGGRELAGTPSAEDGARGSAPLCVDGSARGGEGDEREQGNRAGGGAGGKIERRGVGLGLLAARVRAGRGWA
nr:cell death regulator Aven-like [Aegilops tauschii subsp. strangulata]